MTRSEENRAEELQDVSPAVKVGPGLFNRVLSLGAFASGLAYLSIRFVLRDRLFDNTILNFVVPGIFYIFATTVFSFGAWRLLNNRKDTGSGRSALEYTVLLAIPVLALVSLPAFARHFTAGLASLVDVWSPRGTIYKWDSRGFAIIQERYKLQDLHRKGDEVAHLAAAQAIMVSHASPAILRKLTTNSQPREFRYDRQYWLNRALRGHPPGLAMLYAMASWNAPFARVMALVLTCLIAVIAFWAGNRWDPTQKLGLLMLGFFVGVPNLIWWHAMSVSSDLPPCLFTYGAFGILAGVAAAKPFNAKSDYHSSAQVVLAGILLALGTFVTYTGALATGAATLLILTQAGYPRKISAVAWVLIPTVVALLVGVWYSWLIFSDGNHLLLARVTSFTNPEATAGFISGWRAAAIFVKRLPMDLGWPMVVLLFGGVAWQIFRRDTSFFRRASELCIAAVVLVPAATFFWPEIRFAYPGWLFVVHGLGLPHIWRHMHALDKSLVFGTLMSFSYCKFVLLRLAVPVG